MILPPFEEEEAPDRVANQVKVSIEDPVRVAIAVIRKNNDPNSPASIAKRDGAVKSASFEADSAPDSNTLTAIADYELELAAARGGLATLRTSFDPRRTSHESYDLFLENSELGSRWLVFGWVLSMSVGAAMLSNI